MRYFHVVLQAPQHHWRLRLDDKALSPLSIGTFPRCDVRMQEEDFGCAFEFALFKSGGEWLITPGKGVTLRRMDGGAAGSGRCTVTHGLALAVCSESGKTLLEVHAELHFDFAGAAFDRCISLGAVPALRIGGTPVCELRLQSADAAQEAVLLSRQGGHWTLAPMGGTYPVYRNITPVTRTVTLRDNDFFSVADVQLYLHDSNLYVDSKQPIAYGRLVSNVIQQQTSAMEYPVFIRSSRVQHQIKTDEIEVLQPKEKPKPDRDNMFLKVLPPVAMIVSMLVLRGSMGGSGLMFVAYSGVSMGVSVLVMFLTRKDMRKNAAEDERRRKETYYTYVQNKIDEIKRRRQDELRILDRIYRSTEDNIAIVHNFDKGLFDRSPEDADFLDVRLGRGAREASIKVKTNVPEYREADDELQDMALNVVEQYRILQDAPVVARLSQACAVGVVGKRRWLYEMLKTMTIDLTVRHYYNEVKIYYIIGEEDQKEFAWARWLRNCFDEETGTYRNIICDAESAKFHLEVLYRLLSERESVSGGKATVWPQYYVVFVYRVDMIRNHPVSQYFTRCNALGVRFVFMDEYEERIPRGCAQLIRLDRNASSGSLIYTMDGEKPYQFEYTQIMEERMREIVMKLCKVHVVEANLANEMVKNISLYELLGIKKAQELDLRTNWSRSQIEKSMAVPLGVRTKNAVVKLDLHEKAHGPHGLVAGTTGSGKSEIMQSYIINMALFFHPYEVTFLIIDFKGGGMANQFLGLPHLAGTITDIDGREIDRSLKSIKAELERRKKLFAEAGVNKIDSYIHMYKQDPTSVPAPLPHLIIIVDEFAELKAEQPDFMKELVSAARIGRSLGVHLILATQKPSGVVDGQIWSNSRFKLCLKVQTKEDSQEVLKTPLAAEIREPGRAYLQVGNNEYFELFQSAYSGAKVPNVDPSAVQPYKINELNMWGKPTTVYEVKAKKNDSGDEKKPTTQLDALVEYVADFCREAKITPLPSICLAPLTKHLLLSELNEGVDMCKGQGIVVSVARYDDPEMQRQDRYMLDLTSDNILLLGMAQMGKTTTLQSIVFEAIHRYTPREVNFYIIDAGTMAMMAFRDSKHVGGVVLLSEEDRVRNLFKLLTAQIQERKSRFMACGVGTYRAYLEAGKRDMPQIVLVIDNVAAFREYYEQYDDTLQMLAREGLSVGLSLLVTGTASSNLNYRTLSNFNCKVCFTCNDTSEYTAMVGARRMEPANCPGRALVELDKRVLEAQFALPTEGETEQERRKNMEVELAQIAALYDEHAKPIPVVPEVLSLADAMKDAPEKFRQPYEMVVGMDYSSVEYVTLKLDELSTFVISGRPKSGKHTAVKNILRQIQANVFIHLSEAIIFDGPRRSLSAMKTLGCVKSYITDTSEMKEAVDALWQEMSERQDALFALEEDDERMELTRSWPLKLLVINSEGPIKLCMGDSECQSKLYDVVARFNDCKCCVIWCEYPNAKASILSSNELERYIQTQGNFLYFDYLNNLKLAEVSLQNQRMLNRPYLLGDAYLRLNEQYQHIKTMLTE